MKPHHGSLEETAIATRMMERTLQLCDASAGAMIVYNLMGLVSDSRFAQPENLPILFVSRLSFIGACLLYFFIPRTRESERRVTTVAIQVANMALYAFFLYRMVSQEKHATVAIPSTIYLMMNFFCVLGSPYRRRAQYVLGMTYLAFGALAVSPAVHIYYRYLLILSVILGVALIEVYLADRMTRLRAREEFRSRIRIAPMQLVRRSVLEGVSLKSLLTPRMRTCICLASDWRGYQSVSKHMTPNELAQTLGEYYDLCQRLLTRFFPSGNYYSDWIADELLITFLSEKPGDERALARQALEFARWLILAKEDFLTRHPVPHAIDIGLSFGTSLVGQTGLASHRKVMALGSVPLEARRLQVHAKAQRARMGDADRIAVSASLMALVTGGDARRGGEGEDPVIETPSRAA